MQVALVSKVCMWGVKMTTVIYQTDSQQTQNICITFVQCRTNVLCLLAYLLPGRLCEYTIVMGYTDMEGDAWWAISFHNLPEYINKIHKTQVKPSVTLKWSHALTPSANRNGHAWADHFRVVRTCVHACARTKINTGKLTWSKDTQEEWPTVWTLTQISAAESLGVLAGGDGFSSETQGQRWLSAGPAPISWPSTDPALGYCPAFSDQPVSQIPFKHSHISEIHGRQTWLCHPVLV